MGSTFNIRQLVSVIHGSSASCGLALAPHPVGTVRRGSGGAGVFRPNGECLKPSRRLPGVDAGGLRTFVFLYLLSLVLLVLGAL